MRGGHIDSPIDPQAQGLRSASKQPTPLNPTTPESMRADVLAVNYVVTTVPASSPAPPKREYGGIEYGGLPVSHQNGVSNRRSRLTCLPGVSHPSRPGQTADRRWKPDSNTVRLRSSEGPALSAACTRWQPDPTSRRSGSPAAPAVDTRSRPDPTSNRSGNRAVARSRLLGSLATEPRLAQE